MCSSDLRAFARMLEPVEVAGRGVDETTALRDEVRRRIAAELPAEQAKAAAAARANSTVNGGGAG